MTVKEVMALAAENLGREDLSSALAEEGVEIDGELKSLLRCYNLVENEVALDFCPLVMEEKVAPQNGQVSYSVLHQSPVDIYSVQDEKGYVSFRLHPSHLSLPEGTGEVTITYAYAPAKKTAEEESAFSGKISARLLSYGVAAEFCLTTARYNEAALFERRFHDALKAAQLHRKKLWAGSIRSRRWV